MFQPVKIAPSILSADFMHLADEVEMLEKAGAGSFHIDVMDGHFVPNITMGIPVLKQLAKTSNLPLDVHLMVSNPLEQMPWFVDAGADSLTVHLEALDDAGLVRAIELAHDAGCDIGVAIKPATDVAGLAAVIGDIDMVVVMGVEPGFSGQAYLDGTEDKVADVCAMARSANVCPRVQVDGGIDRATAPLVTAAGADVLVSGNAVLGAADPAAALLEIQQVAEQARLCAEAMGTSE